MIINKGNIQNSIYNDNKYNNSKINWDASYDGELAKVDMNINDNGIKKHINMSLNNEDLADLLNVPSINEDLHKRIKKDFEKKNLQNKSKSFEPLFIELKKNNMSLENEINKNDIELFHEIRMKKYTPKNSLNKYSRRYSKNSKPKTMRLRRLK
jgi:hypothetical protein